MTRILEGVHLWNLQRRQPGIAWGIKDDTRAYNLWIRKTALQGWKHWTCQPTETQTRGDTVEEGSRCIDSTVCQCHNQPVNSDSIPHSISCRIDVLLAVASTISVSYVKLVSESQAGAADQETRHSSATQPPTTLTTIDQSFSNCRAAGAEVQRCTRLLRLLRFKCSAIG